MMFVLQAEQTRVEEEHDIAQPSTQRQGFQRDSSTEYWSSFKRLTRQELHILT